MSRAGALCVSFVIVSVMQTGCLRAPSTETPRRVEVWTLPAPAIARSSREIPGSYGSLIEIDSVSLRPVEVRRGLGYEEMRVSDSVWAVMHTVVPALVTTFQGARYHPETVRALANDSVVLDRFASRLVTGLARDKRVVLDFQGTPPEDVPELAAVARAIGRYSRVGAQGSLALIVPPQDTVAYPTLILARLADLLIVRLAGEHRPGTPAGPPVTPDFITRAIGVRASLIGASRIGVEIPLFGYLWRGETVAPITFANAQALVKSESGVLTRDPPSQFLTASGRDGWTLWVPDARTIQFIAGLARRRGVTSFHLAGPDGADPEILIQRNQLLR